MDSPFLAALRTAQTILVAVHVRPDGDAVASLGAAVSILRDNGFQAFGILPEQPSKDLAPFLPAEGILQSAEGIEADVFITADCSKPDRVAAGGYPFEHCQTLINIDHHPDNPNFGTLNLVAPDAAACTENLYALFRDAGFRISQENATRLLLGLITDSGCFRFQNTSPNAFRTAAELMELGADHKRIIVTIFSSRPERFVRLEAEFALNRLKTAFGGKFAWMYLDPEVLAKYGVEMRETDSLIEIPRNIDGVEIAATLRPEKDGWKASLRAKREPYSAGRIARALGGGGHEMAAGCTITAPTMEEAEKILLQHVETELNQHEKHPQ